jgi:outer membrane lipoprotein-sorting protein
MRKPWMKNWTDKQISPQRHRDTVNRPKKESFFGFLRVSVSLWLFGCLAVVVWADGRQKLTVEEVCQKVETAQASVKDAQMDLNMEVKDTLSGAQQNMSGRIQIKAPDLVYVHYAKPTEQFLYIDKSLVQMYQPDQKMVYLQHNTQAKNASPVYVGVGKQLENYVKISKVTFFKYSDSEVGLLFKPLDALNAGFDSMKVYVHTKDWWPYQMEVETPSTLSKAKFSNFSFDQGLADSIFRFTAPQGVRVVDGEVF